MNQPTVFISYSHDSPTHSERILNLAWTLRRNGIDVELDQFHNEKIVDWPRWCREQISRERTDFVLCVCTAEYRRRIEGDVPPEKGKGVYWEGSLLDDDIYDEKGNRRIIPILLDDEAETSIVRFLRGWTYCRIRTFTLEDSGYEHLLRILTGQTQVEKNQLGELPRLSTRRAPDVQLRSVFDKSPETLAPPQRHSRSAFWFRAALAVATALVVAAALTGDFVDVNVGWVAGKDGTLSATPDGGKTWTALNIGLSQSIVSVDLLDSRTGWVLTEGGVLAATRDGGGAWKYSKAEGARLVRFWDAQRGVLTGNAPLPIVRHTDDGGTTWKVGKITDGFTFVGPVDLTVAGTLNAWVAPYGQFNQGGILATLDGGRTWNKQSTRDVYYMTGLSVPTQDSGWAVGYVYGQTFGAVTCKQYTTVVFKTTSGVSWEPTAGVCGFGARVSFAGAAAGWLALQTGRDSSAILVTADGGRSWRKQYSGTKTINLLRAFDRGGWAIGDGVVLRHQR